MSTNLVILCDERDAEIAEAALAALKSRGHAGAVVRCDASAEALDKEQRQAMAGAAAVVVVVREGGRGTRLLRAAEDEARPGTTVLSLIADASAAGALSARTEARIHTLAESVSALLGGGAKQGQTKDRRARVGLLIGALALAVVAVAGAVLALWIWPAGVSSIAGPQVALSGALSNAGWILTFHLPEEASEIEYKRPSDPDFISTGTTEPSPGQGADRPRARTHVVLPGVEGRVPFLIRYWTLSGAERGPYEVVFDADAEAIATVKRSLSFLPEWVSFRAFNGRRLCYFTTLVTFKYALRSIRYGLDTQVPNRTVRFAPSRVPGVANNDELYIDVPDDTSFVTVELVYLDGSLSDRKRFDVRF
jgi:hypothetical protein